MKKKIKLFDPVVGIEEENVIKKVLHSHFWASGAGIGYVQKFEKDFNKYIGSNNCIALNSGTAALHLALSLFNVKNKEVLLPSLSFVTTAHAVIYNGGKPVFVDVDPKTLCMDPEMIKKFVTKKTVVILPVHFGGMPCDLDKILDICNEWSVTLVEDAAHAAGASYKKIKIGNHGTAVCFSFHPVKNLSMPTGGAITLNGKDNNRFTRILQSKRWCGISNRNGAKYDVTDLGWNYYMNEFSAALGIEQLKKLNYTNSIRCKIARRYSKEIILDSKMSFNPECSYHLYWIQVKNRDSFMKKMKEYNIETGIHYLPIHTMKFYKDKTKLPVTENASKNLVSIPIHPNLSEADVSKIIELTNKFS